MRNQSDQSFKPFTLKAGLLEAWSDPNQTGLPTESHDMQGSATWSQLPLQCWTKDGLCRSNHAFSYVVEYLYLHTNIYNIYMIHIYMQYILLYHMLSASWSSSSFSFMFHKFPHNLALGIARSPKATIGVLPLELSEVGCEINCNQVFADGKLAAASGLPYWTLMAPCFKTPKAGQVGVWQACWCCKSYTVMNPFSRVDLRIQATSWDFWQSWRPVRHKLLN